MRCLRGLESLPGAALENPVTCVGIFDGVHRGHRQMLYELKLWADSVGGRSCVITFDRHPLTILRGIEVLPILSVESRLLELERHGVDTAILLDFAAIRELSARAFLRDLLREGLGCRRLLLGFDSHIGKDRQGTPANLPRLGAELGIEVRLATRVLDREGKKIGSSFIREAIGKGDLAKAANLLGRPVAIRGEVVRGAGRGKGLGTATANLGLLEQVLPPDGVYLVRVFSGAKTSPGVANLGVRPTFEEGGARTLEVHIPGWEDDLYGEMLEVRLVRRLREERKFESVEALKAQIQADLEALARAVADGEI